MSHIDVLPHEELAPASPVDLTRVRRPAYGRTLDDLEPGRVFVHPRGLTFTPALLRDFAMTFHQANPLYLNVEVAKHLGHAAIPASPQLVFNVVLSLGVQNDSEKAIANLGYYDALFVRPVYAGDTLTAMTKVLDRKDRGADKPGIVTIRTIGLNQRNELVLRYDRKVFVGHRKAGEQSAPDLPKDVAPAWPEGADTVARAEIPVPPAGRIRHLTGPTTYAEDFAPGDIVVHPNGRTITDEHVAWTYRVGNTHPLHYDRLFSTSREGKMSGEPIVYGGLVFAWLEGLASRDATENALAEIGFTEGYHTQPAFAGDTVAALSRVLAVAPAPVPYGASLVTLQLVGVKNVRAAAALDRFGAALFQKENDKERDQKIPEKIFEVERRVLIRNR
ncbi:MAG: MaoC family dehydratase N-terminal domain-containing protein [Deltaproteobacteria bacterium]|nr:MaoC family dehydratase N-terminal domain-containing protein [Deltaproteobacteria bacterium]